MRVRIFFLGGGGGEGWGVKAGENDFHVWASTLTLQLQFFAPWVMWIKHLKHRNKMVTWFYLHYGYASFLTHMYVITNLFRVINN